MQKVLKSYSREAKQNHEIIRPTAGQTVGPDTSNGQVVEAREGRRSWTEPFEERSTFETHEQYRSKLKRPRSRSRSKEAAEKLRGMRQAIDGYSEKARQWLSWVVRETRKWEETQRSSLDVEELGIKTRELQTFRSRQLPPKHEQKQSLAEIFAQLQNALGRTDLEIDLELSTTNLDRAWEALLRVLELEERELQRLAGDQATLEDLTSGLDHGIRATNGKLDHLGNRIGGARSGIQSLSNKELKEMLDEIVKDLHVLEPPIDGFFKDVEKLRAARHGRTDYYHGKVYGLHDRRTGYLQDVENLVRERNEWLIRRQQDLYEGIRADIFRHCEQCIEWTEQRILELKQMDFPENHEMLHRMFEKHKQNNQVIVDFHSEVDQCIAGQSEVSAEDAPTYADLLSTLESNYQQLRDLSMGRMLDMDSLIAFVKAAQRELDWITVHEEPEVKRDWSDVGRLPFAQMPDHFKRLILDISDHEAEFNAVHGQGAALLNSGHPAGRVIELYLTRMQTQWDWLLSLTKCFEVHFEDATRLNQFMGRARECEEWIDYQRTVLETRYSMTDLTLEEGEQFLKEIEEIGSSLDQYHSVIMSLLDESTGIAPMWQRGEQINHVVPVTAICEYPDKDIMLQRSDDCLLLDNSELMKWLLQSPDGTQGYVPSVNLRIPPPDDRMLGYLQRLRGQFDKVQKLWGDKHRLVRFNMIMNSMRSIRAWDLEKFLSIDPDQREGIMNALNNDTSKLIGEMEPTDPLGIHLKEELDLTNEHFYRLLQLAQKGPDDDLSADFDQKLTLILPNLEKAWKRLNDNVAAPIPQTPEKLDHLLTDQKDFEDQLQGLDSEIAAVKEIFHMLKEPNPMQRARMDELLARWEDLWELSRLYVERLKSLEELFHSLLEVSQIVKAHEDTLTAYKDMPADLESVRALHSQLLELNMVLKQQQPTVDHMGRHAGHLRQHVARTRYNIADHPDVDEIDDEVQRLVDRWENIGVQVSERLQATEMAIQDLIAYRATFDNEIPWLENVEKLIDALRSSENIDPEDYQNQLDMLLAQYNQLSEHTQAFETMNHDGGKFIRESKIYDVKLEQFREVLIDAPSTHFGAALLSSQNIEQMTRKVNELQMVNDQLEKQRILSKMPENQQLRRGIHDLKQIIATLPHLDSKLRKLQEKEEITSVLEQKLQQLEHLGTTIQDLQKNFKMEESRMDARLKDLQKSQREVTDQAHYDHTLKETTEILVRLSHAVKKLDDMEIQRQFEVFEAKRRLQELSYQDDIDHPSKCGSDQVSEELDDANRRFSQLASIILERRNEILTLNQTWKRRQQDAEALKRATEAEAARLKAEVEKSHVPFQEDPVQRESRPTFETAPSLEDRVNAEAAALKSAVEKCFIPISGEQLRRFIYPTVEQAPILSERTQQEAEHLKSQVEKCNIPIEEEPVKKPIIAGIEVAPNLKDRISKEAEHLKAQVEKCYVPINPEAVKKVSIVTTEEAPNLNDRIREEGEFLKAQVEKCLIPITESPVTKLAKPDMETAPNLNERTAEEAAYLKAYVVKCFHPITEEPLIKEIMPVVETAPELVLENVDDLSRFDIAARRTDELRQQIEDENARLQDLNDEIRWLKTLEKPVQVPVYEEDISIPRRPEMEIAPRIPPSVMQSMQQAEAIPFGETEGFEETRDAAERARMAEHEEEVEMFVEETITKTQFYELEAVKVIETGEILTFVEAIRQGLLDLHSGEGEFYDIVSGSRISLEKAAQLGYITQNFNDCLNTRHGIKDPATGEEVTLLQAIQLGLYDPESRQLKDPATGESLALYDSVKMGIITLSLVPSLVKMGVLKLPPMHIKQAIDQRVINVETGIFTGRYSRESMPLKDALRNGYISLGNEYPPLIAVSLSDCLEKKFINPHTGEFKDRNSQDAFSLKDAIEASVPLVNVNVREVVNTRESTRITLAEAISHRIVNLRNNTFTDAQVRQPMQFQEAVEKDFMRQPMTLAEANRKDLVDSLGRFVDGGLKKRVTLLEAIADGLLDPDVKHIVDPEERDIISLSEALERGVLNADGKMHHPETGVSFTILEAVHQGLIVDHVQHTLFDVKAIKDTKTGRNLTFNEAVEEGIIIPGSERVVDMAAAKTYRFDEALERKIIDPTFHQIMSGPLGLMDQKHLSAFQAVCRGIIEPQKKIFLDQKRNQELSPQAAYEAGLLNLKGAMLLSAILDVNATLVVTSKPAKHGKRRISRPGAAKDDSFEQLKITLADAMRQGLVDTRTQRFRQGDEEMSLQEALNQGLINAEREWIVPDKAMGAGPTIEESVTEKMTETSQALAPKIYPDKTLEESVTTVKKVKTTETVAVGGPGGVSAYRAVTGGKGSLEVPSNGFHLYEAERNGLIDLSTGIITPPDTQSKLSLEEAFELGMINSKHISVKDVKTGKTLSVNEAIDSGVMAATGHVYVDYKMGGRLTLQTAIENGIVVVEPEPPTPANLSKKVIQFGTGTGPIMSFTPVGEATFEEAETVWTFDTTTGEVIDEYTGDRLSLDDALRMEKVEIENVRIRDSLTGREMSYKEAIKWGIIDKDRKFYTDKRDGKRYSLQEAATNRFIFLTGDVPEHAGDAVQTRMKQQTKKQVTKKKANIAGPAAFVDYTLQKVLDLGWYNPDTGLFTHPDTKKQMTLKESIIKGLFNPYDSYINDTSSHEKIGLLDAIQAEIVDATTGLIKDKKSGRSIDLLTASNQGLISSAVVPQTLETVLENGQLQANTGILKTSDGRETLQLHEAIKRGYIDGLSINVVDAKTGNEISFHEAVNQGMIDLQNGSIKSNNQTIHFSQALELGIFRPVVMKMRNAPPGLSIEPSRMGQSLPSPKSAKGLPSPKETPLARVRHAGRKTPPVSEMPLDYGRESETHISSSPSSAGRQTTSTWTASYEDSSSKSRLDDIFSGSPYVHQSPPLAEVQHEESRHAVVPAGRDPRLPLFSGNKREELVDLGGGKKVNVKVVRGEDGVDRGEYIDPGSGMKFTVHLHGDPYTTQTKTMVKSTSQVQSVELEPHAELVGINKVKDLRNGRVMTLNEAQRLGLAKVDKKGKQMTKTYAVFRSDIGHALSGGVVHPATGERMSLEDAIHCKLINISQMTYANPVSGQLLDFTRAANMGLMDVTLAEALPKGVCNPANGERLSIEKAISMNIINPHTGQVFNPFNQERITWLDILKPIYSSLTMEGVYDPIKGYPVPLSSAVNDGLIDPHAALYINPITEESLPLPEAAIKGLMDHHTLEVATKSCIEDWRSGTTLNLLEAIDAGIVDTRNRRVVLSQGLVLPVYKAVQDGKFPPEVGALLRRAEKWTFAEALGQGLIDLATDQFTDPDSGRKMTLEQAFDQGFVDTETVHGGPKETNLSQVIENHDYDDESGRLRDRKTGLTHTFRQAIDEGLIDRDSLIYDLESGRTMTIKEAMGQGLLDNNGKYIDHKSGAKVNLKDAVNFGLIALIASPAVANQAVAEAIKRRDAEGFRFKLGKVDGDRKMSPDRSPKTRKTEFASVHIRTASPSEEAHQGSHHSHSTFLGKVKNRFSPIKKEKQTPQKEQPQVIQSTPRRPFGQPVIRGEEGEIPLKTSTPMETVTPVIHVEESREERVDVTPPVPPTRRRIIETRHLETSGPFIEEPSPKLPRHPVIQDVSDIREPHSSPRIEELPSEISISPPKEYSVTFSETLTFPRQGHSPRSQSSGSYKSSPDLNIRITTDDTARRMRNLIDDPEALAAHQQDFLAKMERTGFPVDEPMIKNPVSGRMMSTRTAVESGLLDVITAEVAHPMSGRRYSLPRSVRLQMIPAEVARSVMELLNMSVDDLPPVAHSGHGGASLSSARVTTVRDSRSPTGATEVTTREVSWKGLPRDLRERRGDLSGR